MTLRTVERRVFKFANTWLMLPVLRAGLGRWMSSPFTGYFAILQTRGRKSGRPRYTPLNYVIDQGSVICLAGFGDQAHWLANLRQDPNVRVDLSHRTIDGIATEVQDPTEARRLALKLTRNCGFALVFEDPRCLFMSDDALAETLAGRPVVRIQPTDVPLVAGPYDPGGRGWIAPMLIQLVAALAIVALVRRRARIT